MLAETFGNLIVCTRRMNFLVGSSNGHGEHDEMRDSESPDDADNRVIREVSMFHMGHYVNAMIKGSLVNKVHCHQMDKHAKLAIAYLSNFWDSVGLAKTDDKSEALVNASKSFTNWLIESYGCEELAHQWPGNFSPNSRAPAEYNSVQSHITHITLFASLDGWIGQTMSISEELYIFLWEIQKRLEVSLDNVGRIGHADWRAFESELRSEACSGFIDGDLVESLLFMDMKSTLNYLNGIRIKNQVVENANDLKPILGLLSDLKRRH